MQNKLRMELQKIVEEAYKEKKYRPCIVAILVNSKGRILLVQSKKNENDWSFPQGGIDQDEDVAKALHREIEEETGIKKVEISNIQYIDKMVLDAEPGRTDKRQFTKGKLYVFFRVLYTGENFLTLDENELTNYKWVAEEVFDEATQTTREEKRAMMKKMLLK